MRVVAVAAFVALAALASTGPTTQAGPVPGCGGGLPALKHNVGVVNPGESVWFKPDLTLGGPELIGIYWFLTSLDADLYLWSHDCTEVWCASTNHGDPLDGCEETDCCTPGGYEVRYHASPAGTPVPFELKWCWSALYCVPY